MEQTELFGKDKIINRNILAYNGHSVLEYRNVYKLVIISIAIIFFHIYIMIQRTLLSIDFNQNATNRF